MPSRVFLFPGPGLFFFLSSDCGSDNSAPLTFSEDVAVGHAANSLVMRTGNFFNSFPIFPNRHSMDAG